MLTVHTSGQGPHPHRLAYAAALDLDPANVHVVCPDTGGAFGAKALPYPEELVVAHLARALERPMLFVETRTESMAFLYGSATTGTPGPDPADPNVVVEDVPEVTVISLGVRGSYREERFAEFTAKLEAWLDANPEWVAAGPPRTLAYNSPFVPGVIKYAEVQIPVAPAAPAKRP